MGYGVFNLLQNYKKLLTYAKKSDFFAELFAYVRKKL